MKKIIKIMITLFFYIVTALPMHLIYKIVFFSSSKCFTTISELISLFPGYIGYFVRQTFYSLTLKTGKNLHIGFGSILQYPSIKIGNNVYIGQNCNIAKCTIASGTKIGSSVHIINKKTHNIDENNGVMPTNIEDLKRVFVGKDGWIGNCSVILADIGDNCIIGAASVVVKPIPDNSIVVGNPAKVIRRNR